MVVSVLVPVVEPIERDPVERGPKGGGRKVDGMNIFIFQIESCIILTAADFLP